VFSHCETRQSNSFMFYSELPQVRSPTLKLQCKLSSVKKYIYNSLNQIKIRKIHSAQKTPHDTDNSRLHETKNNSWSRLITAVDSA
jgi:hypothetical protein